MKVVHVTKLVPRILSIVDEAVKKFLKTKHKW